ncbi:sugar ABC transporter permease [Natronospirillum operosum]|uniref:Sugar ABC transporter permease n=1 Tax=Natronospirillum operosum TaxID=2759953 RepID=A0A4Z0WB10_9GAMM|nr:sugar ABC transporter permease [Natronospirillum operosum]TGG93545.1 sugar ABC transporter permease [Natronospirillum operosum]
MKAERRFAYLMMAPACLFLLLLVAYPVLLLVYNSFFDVPLIDPSRREFIGLGNYIDVLQSSRVRESAGRTLRYTAFALSFEMLFGFGAALIFSALGRRSKWHRTIFTLPLMIPPIVAGLLWRFLLAQNTGLVNNFLAAIGIIDSPSDIAWLSDPAIVLYAVALPDIWITTSFVALIVYAGLQNIPQDQIEAAKIDGASAIRRFWHITLPTLRPVIAVVLIIRGVDAAKTFDLIWIQTQGGPRFQSEVLSMNIYQRMVRYGDLGEASASATLFTIVMVIIAVIAYKKIWSPDNEK